MHKISCALDFCQKPEATIRLLAFWQVEEFYPSRPCAVVSLRFMFDKKFQLTVATGKPTPPLLPSSIPAVYCRNAAKGNCWE